MIAILLGFRLFSGTVYGLETDDMYLRFPVLRIVNILNGVLILAYGVFCIITRFRLAHFKKNSVFLLFATYIVIIFLPFIYQLMAAAVTKVPVWTWTELGGNFITHMVLLSLNVRYYGRRIEFFVK